MNAPPSTVPASVIGTWSGCARCGDGWPSRSVDCTEPGRSTRMIRRPVCSGTSIGPPRSAGPPPVPANAAAASASRSIRSRSPATIRVPGRRNHSEWKTVTSSTSNPATDSGSPCIGRPQRFCAPNRSARSAASARGPGLAQSIRSAVASSSRTRRTSAGSSLGVRTASASSSTAALQPVHRDHHAGLERVPVQTGRQRGAEPFDGERVRGGVPLRGPLLQRLGQHTGQALLADRLLARAHVEQQQGHGEVLPRQVRGDDLTTGHGAADHRREPVRAGGTRAGTVGDQRHEVSSGR